MAEQYLTGSNIRLAWDSTCLTAFKTCPRLYKLSIIDGWTPKTENDHLRFGSEYHRALQDYDIEKTKGSGHKDAMSKVLRDLLLRTMDWHPNPDSKAGKYKNIDTLTSLVVDYLDHFINDPARTYIKFDGSPAIEQSFRFEIGFGPKSADQAYLLCGHLDRIVEFNDQLMIMDRKTTTTTLGDYYFKQWEPNIQMALYILAGRVILDTALKGVIIDAAQILLDKPNRFVRGFTYRTEDQIQEWLDDLVVVLDSAERAAQSDKWIMNESACDKYGGCKFRDVCSKSPSVREKFLRANFIQLTPEERWNPLTTR